MKNKTLNVKAELTNLGVAPFYYDWTTDLGLFAPSGKLVKTKRGTGNITGIRPREAPTVWNEAVSIGELPKGKYKVLVRVVNPLPQGKPLRFANEAQDKDLSGWLTLGEVAIQ